MNRIVLSLSIVLIFFISQNAMALLITSPANGTTFNRGDIVTIVAELENSDPEIAFVNFFTTKGVGNCPNDISTHPRYVCAFTIPSGTPQTIVVGAIATTVDSFVSAPQVSINATDLPAPTLQRISIFNNDELYFSAIGQTVQIYLSGIYSDGIKRDLKSASTGTIYKSLNKNIVAVNPDGLVESVGLGDTQVTISNGDQTIVQDAEVHIKIYAPTGLNVKAADTGLRLDWLPSEQDPEWVTECAIFRSEDVDGVSGKKIGSVHQGTNTYLDTTALQDKKYYYSVQAYSKTAQSFSDLTPWVYGLKP